MPYDPSKKYDRPFRQPRPPKPPLKKRPGREYDSKGRLIKIDPAEAKPCQIIDQTGTAIIVKAKISKESGFEERTEFPSRRWARKALNQLIKELPPRKDQDEPRYYTIQNL